MNPKIEGNNEKVVQSYVYMINEGNKEEYISII